MDFELYSNISTALANNNRLQIVLHLAQKGEDCAQSLLSVFEISQPTMSQHLKILRQAKIISVRKSGRWQYFSVNTNVVEEFINFTKRNFLEPAILAKEEVEEPAPTSSKARVSAEKE